MKKDIKIFIADSDDYSTFVYKNLLKELGYRHIFTMSDAESCVRSMVLNPDIVFLDYSISGNKGIEVLRRIKPRLRIRKIKGSIEGLGIIPQSYKPFSSFLM